MKDCPKLSRRKFIKRSALTTGAITIVPRFVLGRGFVPPSDKINLGFIGLGIKGVRLTRDFVRDTNAQIIAGSDVWTTKNAWFKKHVEDTYANVRKQTRYKGVSTTVDYRALLARPDIDAVVIATPDHWHAIQSIEAMEAGKDVYCEKPMTLTIQEGIDMIKTTKKTDAVLQVGSMQRSWQKFQVAVQLVKEGYLGDIKKVLVSVGDPAIPFNLPAEEIPKEVDWNGWCGPAPLLPYNYRLSPPEAEAFFPDWRKYKETGGGILTDWGAHMFDIAQWALGMDRSGPVRFEPPADRKAVRGIRMFYENGVEMVHEDFGRGYAVRFIGTEGILDISRGFLETNPATLLQTKLEASKIVLDGSTGNHSQNWLDAIKDKSLPICDVEIGHRSATVGNICNIAYELGRPLDWDPNKEKFIADKEANKMKKRKRRKF